ncbi:Ig-like domain-containing protein [Candidatus Peregrinibacteria bacterium]|nr:Ig-like domain-containing protein [Candidatus Peregrinibacteria bacterium]
MKFFGKKFWGFFGVLLLLTGGGVLLWSTAGTPRVLGGEEETRIKEISFNALLRFEFTERMNAKSVESAFSLAPEMQGRFFWENQKTLFFEPSKPFEIGEQISVTIDGSAESWLGKVMGKSYFQTFLIVGPPQITFISPISPYEWNQIKETQRGDRLFEEVSEAEQKKDEELPKELPIFQKDQRIVLMFDRPIRPLETPEENLSDSLSRFSDYLTFEPEIQGKFHWLGTSAIEFIPDENTFPLGNIFRAHLKKEAPTADGGRLIHEAEWHFETEEPKIVSITPSDTATFISPKTKVRILWNQSVNENSFFDHLTISPDLPSGEKRKLKITWDHERDPNAMMVSFEPNFAKNETISLVVDVGVKSLNGTKMSTEATKSTFRTMEDPGVVTYSPQNGGSIAPHESLRIQLRTPTDTDEILKHISFSPEIDPKKLYVSQVYDSVPLVDEQKPVSPLKQNILEYEISGPFLAETAYAWTLNAQLKDARIAAYKEDVKSGILDAVSDKEYQELEKESLLPTEVTGTFRTTDYKSQLSYMARTSGPSVFERDDPVSLFVQHRNISKIFVTVCEIPEKEFLDMQLKFLPLENGFCDTYGKNPRSWTKEISGEKNITRVDEISISDEIEFSGGIYGYEFFSPEFQYSWEKAPHVFTGTALLVNSGITAKWTDEKILVWATDFLEGKPVENMSIEVLSGSYDNPVTRINTGYTNAQGIWEGKLPADDLYRQYFIIARKGKDFFSLVGNNWSEGISPWEFGIPEDWQIHPFFRGYMYTDRPIYRPGQTVYYKGILRSDNDANLQIPAQNTVVHLQGEDPEGKEIFSQDVTLSDMGTFSGELLLADGASLGTYVLNASLGDKGWFTRTFSVEEYRKPEYKVEVKTSLAHPFLGTELPITISAEYFFGGSLPNADVSYLVVREPYFYYGPEEGEWYSFSTDEYGCYWSCSPEETVVLDGTGKLDAHGKFSFSIPDHLNAENGDITDAQLVTVYATLRDASERNVSKAETFMLLEADGFVGIRPENSFLSTTDMNLSFDLFTLDVEGNPRPNEEVDVKIYQSIWNSVQKEGIDGNFYWDSTEEKILLQEKNAETGKDGRGGITFDIPQGDDRYSGTIKAIATWKDSSQRETRSAATLFRSSDDYIPWQRSNNDRIKLTLDKKSYEVGDTAKLLVESPFVKPVKALLTVERKNILSAEVVEVKSGELLEIPVTEEMLPNAYIGITLVKGKGFFAVFQKLFSEISEKKILQKELEFRIPELTSKVLKNTGELAALTEASSDLDVRKAETRKKISQENLKNTEEKLNMTKDEVEEREKEIQKLLPNLSEEEQKEAASEEQKLADDLKNFTPPQKDDEDMTEPEVRRGVYNLNTLPRPEMKIGMVPISVNIQDKELKISVLTEKESYLPGDTVRLLIETRKTNRDVTSADVSIAVVDKSLLALKSRNLEDILDFFWGNRPLGVRTAQTLIYLIERLDIKAQGGAKGGGGGALGEDLSKRKRGEFRDTAFWKADLHTDENGLLEVEFRLPDNLTTWEVLVIAHTKDNAFGMEKKSFISRKQLMITSALPRFGIPGDTFTAAFLIYNQSDTDQKINVFLDTEGFSLKGVTTFPLTIKRNSTELIEFPGTIMGSNEKQNATFPPMKFTLLVQNEDKSLRDEVETFIPVTAPILGENLATSGIALDRATEYLRIPQKALPNLGKLTVTLASSRIQMFLRGAESLLAYPYDSAEQIMSRVLARALLIRAENMIGKKSAGASSEISENFTKILGQELQETYKLQRSDGGFGYFEGSLQSYPYLSAYILFGFEQLGKIDVHVDPQSMENLKNYLMGSLLFSSFNEEQRQDIFEMDSETKAFVLYVLSEAGEKNIISTKNLLYEQRSILSLPAKILLSLALQNLEETDGEKAVLRFEIEAAARHTPRGVQFDAGETSPWSMDSTIKTTALALMTFAREDTNNVLIPKILSFLTKARGGSTGSWESTQDTIWAVFSYLEYLEKANVLHPNFAANVEINGSSLLEKSFTEENVFDEKILSDIDFPSLLRDPQLNELTFSKKGIGELFYDILLQYYLPTEEIREKNEGIGLMRNYYKLDDTKMEHPVFSAEKGERLRGKLTLLVPETRYLVSVREALPAGLEAVNFNLETADKSLLLNDENTLKSGDTWYWWNNLSYFEHTEIRDDAVLLFAETLPSGVYEYNFYVEAVTEGSFEHLPAKAEEMYHPEVFGRTQGEVFSVLPSHK